MHVGDLSPPPPYDLNTTAKLLSQYHGVLDVYRDGAYYRALRVNGRTVLVRVTQHGPPDVPNLHIERLCGETVPHNTLLAHTRGVLAAHVDVVPFFAFAQRKPRLWSVVEPLYGVRHFQSETVFEALMIVIIEQQISLYAALRAQRAIAEWGGESVAYEGVRYYTFPLPGVIADANATELHSILKITHRRVAVMQQVAQQIVNSELDLEGLRGGDEAEAYRRLIAIKGIGHWTAVWTLLRSMSHYERVAHNDVALRSAVAYYFHDSENRISADAVVETLNDYTPYAGEAAFYSLLRWAMDRY